MPAYITTKHPSGMDGVQMTSNDYEMVKETVLHIMEEHNVINMPELTRLAFNDLNGKIKGDTVAITTAVENDLEAKGILERKFKAGKHQVVLAKH